jgi:hypothetical protein
MNPMPAAAHPIANPKTGIVTVPWQQWFAAFATGGASASAWNEVASTVGFTNGWTNFGSVYGTAAFRFDADGTVRLRGLIKSGTLNTAAFTLPAGFRPPSSRLFVAWANATLASVEIDPSGAVIPNGGSNLSMTLDGITFSLV